jgi:hypothetical protein
MFVSLAGSRGLGSPDCRGLVGGGRGWLAGLVGEGLPSLRVGVSARPLGRASAACGSATLGLEGWGWGMPAVGLRRAMGWGLAWLVAPM